jgi:hypothetical protein
MELEQHHVIKFLHVKGLKLDETAKESSNIYDLDAYAPQIIKYWLHKSRSGEPISKGGMFGDNHFSMILTLKICQFFGDSHSRQCKQLPTP